MKMSDVDVLIESTITEAPVGMLKRGALKVASKLGSQKAAGAEVTANIANQLKKDYSRYLGVTGYEQDKESLEAFLNSKGLSADSLDSAISSVSAGSPTGQDWRIDTGPRTGAANARVEPVVDIGSATGEVPSLDGESPIEQARAKQVAVRQRVGQQLRGQQPEQQPTEPVTKTNRLAGMGQGYVPPIEPSAEQPEIAQQEPSATGTQAASALGRLKTPQNPMKGRTSLVSKLKGQQAEPEVPAAEPTATRERPGISSRAGKAGVGQPKAPQFKSVSAMSKATSDIKAELDTKLNAIDAAKEALAKSPRSQKLKDALKQAEADYDSFVASEIKPADLKDKLATKVNQIKTGEEPQTQMELPTEEPTAAPDVEKVQSAVEKAQADYDKVNKAGISKSTKDKKLKALNAAKAELASATGTEPEVVPAPTPVSMKSPVAAVKKEQPAAVKAEPKEEPTDKIGKLTAKAQELATAFKQDPSNKELGKQAMGAISALKAAKEADVEPEDEMDYKPSSMGSEFSRFAKAMAPAKTKTASSEEVPPTEDDEDAWMDQEPMPKAKKEKAAKNKKMALAASVEHEFDYLLAEAAFSNKQIDKIILAITQDNIRKGIISIPGVPKPKAKGKATQAAGDQYSIGSAGAGSLGGAGQSQYNQPAQQNAGGKTLDLSDLNVERLISAINHILKKEELQRFEENQLKKLMQELKAVREGRALQDNILAEAPMGLGQRLATGVASKFSSQAAGKLDAGKIANQYKPEYSRYLGSTGGNPDAQSLIDFFTSKRLDTSKIQQITDSVAPNATRLTGPQIDAIIMQVTQQNIRSGTITPAAAQASGGTTQPASQSTAPVMAQRMMNDPAIQSHPEYIRFLNSLK
jgi:hypothetical protein